MFKKTNQLKGFVLIELLVAMTLAIVLIGIFIEIYLTNQRSLNLQNTLVQTQQISITLNSLLKNEIKQAGYIGCPKLTNNFPLVSHTKFLIDVRNKIHGTNNEITIRHAAFPSATIKLVDKDVVITDLSIKYNKDDILLISDCKHAEIVQVKLVRYSALEQYVTLHNVLQYLYDESGEISRLEVNTFYVGKTKRKNKKGLLIPALFMRDISGHTYEMIENVSTLEFLYTMNGIDCHASEVSDWSKVQGVAVQTILADEFSKKEIYFYERVKS